MLSNISPGGIAKRFTDSELLERFDTVVTSGEIGFAKPEAAAYEITAQRLDVRLDECVFTDDRLDFCEAARGVGMQAILFQDYLQFRTDLEKLLQLDLAK
jgi:putative hydrolase of the HAD superfamily